MRLIDADKIIYSWMVDAEGEEHDGVTLQSIIRKMPTIEPERKTGEWIVSDDKYWYTCPFCDADIDVSLGTGVYVDNDEVSHVNFCPNCGEKMEGEKK